MVGIRNSAGVLHLASSRWRTQCSISKQSMNTWSRSTISTALPYSLHMGSLHMVLTLGVPRAWAPPSLGGQLKCACKTAHETILLNKAALLALFQWVHHFNPLFDAACLSASTVLFDLTSCRSNFCTNSHCSYTCYWESAGPATVVHVLSSRRHGAALVGY